MEPGTGPLEIIAKTNSELQRGFQGRGDYFRRFYPGKKKPEENPGHGNESSVYFEPELSGEGGFADDDAGRSTAFLESGDGLEEPEEPAFSGSAADPEDIPVPEPELTVFGTPCAEAVSEDRLAEARQAYFLVKAEYDNYSLMEKHITLKDPAAILVKEIEDKRKEYERVRAEYLFFGLQTFEREQEELARFKFIQRDSKKAKRNKLVSFGATVLSGANKLYEKAGELSVERGMERFTPEFLKKFDQKTTLKARTVKIGAREINVQDIHFGKGFAKFLNVRTGASMLLLGGGLWFGSEVAVGKAAILGRRVLSGAVSGLGSGKLTERASDWMADKFTVKKAEGEYERMLHQLSALEGKCLANGKSLDDLKTDPEYGRILTELVRLNNSADIASQALSEIDRQADSQALLRKGIKAGSFAVGAGMAAFVGSGKMAELVGGRIRQVKQVISGHLPSLHPINTARGALSHLPSPTSQNIKTGIGGILTYDAHEQLARTIPHMPVPPEKWDTLSPIEGTKPGATLSYKDLDAPGQGVAAPKPETVSPGAVLQPAVTRTPGPAEAKAVLSNNTKSTASVKAADKISSGQTVERTARIHKNPPPQVHKRFDVHSLDKAPLSPLKQPVLAPGPNLGIHREAMGVKSNVVLETRQDMPPAPKVPEVGRAPTPVPKLDVAEHAPVPAPKPAAAEVPTEKSTLPRKRFNPDSLRTASAPAQFAREADLTPESIEPKVLNPVQKIPGTEYTYPKIAPPETVPTGGSSAEAAANGRVFLENSVNARMNRAQLLLEQRQLLAEAQKQVAGSYDEWNKLIAARENLQREYAEQFGADSDYEYRNHLDHSRALPGADDLARKSMEFRLDDAAYAEKKAYDYLFEKIGQSKNAVRIMQETLKTPVPSVTAPPELSPALPQTPEINPAAPEADEVIMPKRPTPAGRPLREVLKDEGIRPGTPAPALSSRQPSLGAEKMPDKSPAVASEGDNHSENGNKVSAAETGTHSTVSRLLSENQNAKFLNAMTKYGRVSQALKTLLGTESYGKLLKKLNTPGVPSNAFDFMGNVTIAGLFDEYNSYPAEMKKYAEYPHINLYKFIRNAAEKFDVLNDSAFLGRCTVKEFLIAYALKIKTT